MADFILTAGELIDASSTLALPIDETGAPKIPVKSRKFLPIPSYALKKFMAKAAPELEALENQRVELCERHAKKDESGKPIKRTDEDTGREAYVFEDQKAFESDWKAIRAETVTLPGCRAITLAEIEGADLTPNELLGLGPLVVEEQDQ